MNKYTFFCVALLWPILTECGLQPVQTLIVSEIGKLLNNIQSKFKNEYSTMVVASVSDPVVSNLVNTIFESVHLLPIITVNLNESEKWAPLYSKANIVITVLKNVDQIEFGLEGLRKFSFFVHQAYFFFLIAENVSNMNWFTNTSIDILWANHILHFFYVFHHYDWEILTYNPFTEKVGNWSDNYKGLFADRPLKMNGYVVRGGVVEDEPQSIFGKDGKVYSTDIVVIKSIFKWLNVSLRVSRSYNGSYTKLNDEIIAGKLDCGLSTHFLHNFTTLPVTSHLQFAYPYQINAYVFLLPRPQNRPMYLNIFMVFTIELWTCILVSCILLTLAIVLIDKIAHRQHSFVSRENPFFQTMRLMINLPSAEHQRTIFSKKILFIFGLLLSFCLNALLQSSLISVLVKPKRHNPLTTLRQLSESGIPIYLFGRNFINRLDTSSLLQKQCVFENKTEIVNMIMAGNTNNAYSCSTLQCAEIMIRRSRNKFGKEMFYILQEKWIPGHRGYIFPKNSPFIDIVNRFILFYKEFGLLQSYKFGDWETEKNLIPEPNNYIKHKTTGATILTLDHMQTAFYILLLGYAISFLVFLVEVFHVKILLEYKKMKKSCNFEAWKKKRLIRKKS
ncbi:hypothetical protein RI129_010581 [Pyrocoelia pectoralis]|uniref:Uncharacterized protein n=1 Tax=Pyrocoelia pectoralis TaxID=417401 RepID=A0AAN7Z8S3_9COLE